MEHRPRHLVLFATLLFATSLLPPLLGAAPALAQEYDYIETESIDEDPMAEEINELPQLGEMMSWEEWQSLEEAPEDVPPDSREYIALPGDAAASASSPQAISLPTAEGSVEGMGESFSPVLSAGTGTYSVPIALPAGRAGVQPSLALSYGTSGGNTCVGFGWNLAVPFISRQTDRGLPFYDDRPSWHRQEDRFIYNGGQELVPVDEALANAIDDGYSSPEFAGWQQYRARIEGGFMRFYRAPDFRRWVVESPDGSRLELGELPTAELPSDFGTLDNGANRSTSALESELPFGEGRISRWFLTRMSDRHGSPVYYRYLEDAGYRYLEDVHYVSPASCAAGGDAVLQRNCDAALSMFGRRVRIRYEPRADVFESFVSTWSISLGLRAVRIAVSAAEGAPGTRTMVRRYHLAYDPLSFHSLLASVTVEGRPHSFVAARGAEVGDRTIDESVMYGSASPIGPLLPPMTFGYSSAAATSSTTPGFGGINTLVIESPSSPPHSLDEGRADFYDVNSDGLPDLIVTDPARFSGGGPSAVGVFFNGFSGSRTTPATAGTFSAAVSVLIPSGFSSVFNLANANVVPMDIDGDGRSDMLHMPRFREYEYFTPVRNGDADAVRPADQDWQFAYVDVELEPSVTDPRIDFGSDGTHLRAFDVNNDHLIDVVRTTGTEMQTWLNLGWLPGGDGRFGSFSYDAGSDAYVFSTEPYRSCLLLSGTPVDFEDIEVRLADMNGDGIQDIVRIRRDRVQYWPGRGLGLWGIGPPSCDGTEGTNRYVEMATPPAEINVELAGVFLTDINHDGATDVVQVRFDEVDVWFNRAGQSFTERIIAPNTPTVPAFAPRVRFIDIDGSGTRDIVFGNGGHYEWIDPMGGQRPRLLTSVENGLGALTTLEYGSSADEYLRDLADAESCAVGDSSCDRFTWAPVGGACDPRYNSPGECHRSAGSPVVSTVVTAVQTSDQLSRVGRETTVSRNEYRYHNGYYEGIEQEFRGFGAADALTIAGPNDTHRTAVSRTFFHQGRRPNDIESDRLAFSPYEALKGRERQTESWDATTGTRLSTTHSTFTVRQLQVGLDGRPIQFVFVNRTDSLRYDTSRGFGTEGTLDLPSVVFQEVDPGSPTTIPGDLTTDPDDTIVQRGLGTVQIRSTVESVDNLGHMLLAAALGRPGLDERIEQHMAPERIAGRWLWRQDVQFTRGQDGVQLGLVSRTFDANGNPLVAETPILLPASHPNGFQFRGDDSGADRLNQRDQTTYLTLRFDAWGNTDRVCAGWDSLSRRSCYRWSRIRYDGDYDQFPLRERVHTNFEPGVATAYLNTSGAWDRGLGLLTRVTDPTGERTRVGYDGFGRVAFVRSPPVDGCTSAVPVQRFRYDLAIGGLPISQVTTFAENDCAGIGADVIETRSYVDGLGRTRATLSPASVGDPGGWIQSGVTIFNQRGTVRRAYQQEFVAEPAPSVQRAVRIPASPYAWAGYDAFDRPRCGTTACGQMSCTSYHALSTDVCDALDMSSDPTHAGTCTTARNDGHGRAIDQILRNRQGPYASIEYYRLFTDYRADNAVTVLTRAETTTDGLRGVAPVVPGHQTQRVFTYDSTARRIGATDPDSDSLGPCNARNCTWRYLYNPVGDLAAVRDPRGCGQNFYYDRAGRLIGEDYVECDEAQTASELPVDIVGRFSLSVGRRLSAAHDVDVRYYYDGDYQTPMWATSYPEVTTGIGLDRYMGRLTAVSDRGQRSAMAYDARGLVTWGSREMVLISDASNVTVIDPNPGPGLPPVIAELSPPATIRTYDEAHRYERRASYDHGGRPTGMTLPVDPDWNLLGGTGAAPVIGGALAYDARGLPQSVSLTMDGAPRPVVSSIRYTQHALVREVTYGDTTGPTGASRSPTLSTTRYDVCLRPETFRTERASTGGSGRDLGLVTTPMFQQLVWDQADNLVRVADHRIAEEWPDQYRPQSVDIFHDALYRVVDAEYTYHQDGGASGVDLARNWRTDLAAARPNDPMRTDPAPMVPPLPSNRVTSLTWEYDWLGNMQHWGDDASSFYERSIGDIENGADRSTHERPGALHLASNVRKTVGAINLGLDRGGWVEVDYGENGNMVAMTVHGQCFDSASVACWDDASLEGDAREAQLRSACACATEQHYAYRWDEVNRLAEARRFDRAGVGGAWTHEVTQRYRYDGSNQRTIKQSLDPNDPVWPERVALYVYPGDFERRGLLKNGVTETYDASPPGVGPGLDTETQYLVGGARVVWKHSDVGTAFDRDQRITVALTDLIQTTAAVLDLESGELLESSCYYPNGARESYRAQAIENVAAEPMGFTGKEADVEIGLVYFGARYLVPRLGRWASTDPLEVHAEGEGGEALNSYHYVGGDLLAARDPNGLCPACAGAAIVGGGAIVAGAGLGLGIALIHNRVTTGQWVPDSVNPFPGEPRRAPRRNRFVSGNVEANAAGQSAAAAAQRAASAGSLEEMIEPTVARDRAQAAESRARVNATADAQDVVARVEAGSGTGAAVGPLILRRSRLGRAVLTQASPAVRAGLSRTQAIRRGLRGRGDDIGRTRTVATARVNVSGVSGEVIGVSGRASRGTSFGGARVAGNTTRTGPGRLDAEVKILDDIAERIDSDATGTIDLFVDNAEGVCVRCGTAIIEFRNRFPNVQLNVLAP